MDDDIDIEEHDLLDNPAIKSMFPDLSLLKKEISGFFEEAPNIKSEPDVTQKLINQPQECDPVPILSLNNMNTGTRLWSNGLRHDTPKPEEIQTPLLRNKIILGSKPKESMKIELSDRGEQDPFSAKVYLKDIKSSLEKSDRFCKICLTIFPQKDNLEFHKMAVHEQNSICNTAEVKNRITIGSKLKKYNCNECTESFPQHSLLRRHLINVHRKQFKNNVIHSNHTSQRQISSPLRIKMVKSTKLNQCFHCKVSFSSKRLLIEHIYTVLQSQKGKDSKSSKTEKDHRNQMKTTLSLKKRVLTRKRQKDIGCTRRSQLNNGNNQEKSAPIRHIVTNHMKVQSNVNLQKKISLFQCFYCSYIFSQKSFYMNHLKIKHNDTTIKEMNVKAVKFDEQCKYCLKRNINWKLHNIHMHQYHKEKIEKIIKIYPKLCLPKVDYIMPVLRKPDPQALIKIEDSAVKKVVTDLSEQLYVKELNEKEGSNSANNQLLLKSIIFKCKRCDIHFLSAKSAMDHANHMELLINWKCLLCNKIFKKVDETLHLKQHNFSNQFTVLELTESQLVRILYKCPDCAIHFDANGYLPHCNTCEMRVSESAYCKVCDILVDKNINGSHEKYHSKNKLKRSDFTILNTDVIGPQYTHKTSANPALKKTPKKTKSAKFIYKLRFCKTCKSFISKRGRMQIVHIEARCAHLPTKTCQLCGLVLTAQSMKTHKLLHKERKGTRLEDFTFYDFNNRKLISPPIPDYPKCKTCHVHFISKMSVLNHICNEDFLTCLECNIKLSEPVFKLHMSFHYYSKTNKSGKELNPNNNIHLLKTSEKRQPRPPPRDRDRSAQGSGRKLLDVEVSELNCSINTKPGKNSQSDVNKFMERVNEENGKVVIAVSENSKDRSTQNKDFVYAPEINQVYSKTDLALFNVMYCCINCHITIDTYDGVIEHCQNHLCDIDIEKLECEICELQLDMKSYERHHEYHKMRITNKSLEVLEFDTFYFSLEHKIWLKHVFHNLDNERSQQILYRSIFKYGGKMKMQVIQEGSPDLTVYKCDSCYVIVDPDTLLKHVENSCFKTRKHPCSYCGLPFMSYISLKNHLRIHKKNSISLKSYRIVLINQEKDKKNNKMINAPNKHFVLYKCRNCNSVMDAYQRHNHTTCNEKDLRKCSVCEFMFYSVDFKAHLLKHEWVSNFEPKNMKIVLFGQDPPTNEIDKRLSVPNNFGGIVVDFTFFQCVKCGICLEKSPVVNINHHTCYEDCVMSKCPKCELNILKTKFARHTKLHETNVHFVKPNMNIIPYDHSKQLSKFVPADLNKLNDLGSDKDKTCDLGNDRNAQHSSNLIGLQNDTEPLHTADDDLRISEKTARLFKCSCGLHFLDETSINEHFGCCKSEKSKQHCSKCHLLFTPAVLFSHLPLHHGDKKYIYNFKIVEMSNDKNIIVTLFNCVKCKTNFVEHAQALTHFGKCQETTEFDRKECVKCSLFISSCSIAQHETLHHDDKVADIEIRDVSTDKVNGTDQNETDSRSIDNVIQQADFVRESKYNISEENLSQIDLSRYSNSIYKCETCNTHFLSPDTLRRHFENNKHILSPQDTCNICELRFSLQSLTKHIYIHHKQMKLGCNDFIIKSNC